MERRRYLGAVATTVALAGCGGSASTPDSRFQGGGDDASLVDLEYRDWSGDAIERVKDEAEEVEHDELSRNAEEMLGEPVTATVLVLQRLKGDEYDTLLLSYDAQGSKLAYASWTGDTVLRGDIITLWGEVRGEETYETATAGQRTVPALSLADVRIEGAETNTPANT